MKEDQFGVRHSVSSDAALRHFDQAVEQLLVLRNPVPQLDRALALEPGFVSAQALRGLLGILGTEKSQLPGALEALAAGRKALAGASERERLHLEAIDAWGGGRFADACATWERILLEEPRDALAMYAAHQGDFFLGQSSELRDRVARRLPLLERHSRLAGYYHGMLSFGLEETGLYAQAAEAGVRAVESDPRDSWAVHAVAHVYEMTNRLREGELWLLDRVPDWTEDNFFAVHNWWHLALYYFDAERWEDALRLYDTSIRGGESAVVLDMIDASGLLWRLNLHGVDVGSRWDPIADRWQALIDDAWYAFNDIHAAIALAGAGRTEALDRLDAALVRAAESQTDNGEMARRVGIPVVRAIRAYTAGDYRTAVDLLLPVRTVAARGGGSNAQRDLISLTLLAAAWHAGEGALARALVNERLQLKPLSGINRAWLGKWRTH
jgi:tetratricopeptide (TPR) repeat protein